MKKLGYVTTPNEQAKQMLTIRHKRDQLREALNILDAEYNQLRDALLLETQKHKVLSLKTEDYTISRKKIKSLIILDDIRAINELKEAGYQPSISTKLNWRSMGQAIFGAVEKGELKSAEVKTTEYIAIKKNV